MARYGTVSTGTLIGDGRVAVPVAATRVRLSDATAGNQPATDVKCSYVKVQSETTNTGIMAVGAATVVAADATSRGIRLNPGDIDIIPCDNIKDVWVDREGGAASDGVTFQIFE